jgi:hypothetical protein
MVNLRLETNLVIDGTISLNDYINYNNFIKSDINPALFSRLHAKMLSDQAPTIQKTLATKLLATKVFQKVCLLCLPAL